MVAQKQLVNPPGGERDILLHACCAPCSGAIVEAFVKEGWRPVVFFSNSNIWPREEYGLRRDECRRYVLANDLEFVEDEYDHESWLDAVSGLESEPERGRRCTACFRFRLSRAASYARTAGLGVLTTTLASSRWKDLAQVNGAGAEACADGPLWWPADWRKGGLQPRRSEIIKEQNFYNQQYCGCEFSLR